MKLYAVYVVCPAGQVYLTNMPDYDVYDTSIEPEQLALEWQATEFGSKGYYYGVIEVDAEEVGHETL